MVIHCLIESCESLLILIIMKVALFGSSGLLGSAVKEALGRRGHQCMTFSFRASCEEEITFCLKSHDQVIRELFDAWPDAVVNCAAISSPVSVKQNPDYAFSINVDRAVNLAEVTSHLGARFLHVSTDMVFDGSSAPYRSTDLPNPLNEYGRQKLESEKRVLRVTEENLVVLRITLLNGNSPSGRRSQHEKILRDLSQNKTVVLYGDEIRQPCSSDNVASAIVELLERPNLNGLFHWAGKEEISRYELGLRILDRFGLSRDRVVEGSLENSELKRPRHLSFELSPLLGKIITQPVSIDDQIQELFLPNDLYSWYRKNAEDLSRYIHRIK